MPVATFIAGISLPLFLIVKLSFKEYIKLYRKVEEKENEKTNDCACCLDNGIWVVYNRISNFAEAFYVYKKRNPQRHRPNYGNIRRGEAFYAKLRQQKPMGGYISRKGAFGKGHIQPKLLCLR